MKLFCRIIAFVVTKQITFWTTIPLCHSMMKKRTPSSEILWGYVHNRNRYREFWGGTNKFKRSFMLCVFYFDKCPFFTIATGLWKGRPSSWCPDAVFQVQAWHLKKGIDLFVCQMNKKMLIWCAVNECCIDKLFIFDTKQTTEKFFQVVVIVCPYERRNRIS